MKYLIILLLMVSTQTEWVKEIEKSIKRIDENSLLKSEFKKNEKDGKVMFKQFTLKNETKTKIEYKYGKLMDIERSLYKNEKIIFAEIVKGKDVLIYKRKRKNNEPYAVLIEKRTYFKNKNEGIKKTRRIKIFKNSNVENLEKELEKKEFKIEKIGIQEYNSIKEQYDRIIKMNN
jgi:hypothetical protein